VSWNRATVAQALADAITAGTGGAFTVHTEPPQTLNPPCVVIGPTSRPFSTAALSVDEVDVAVMLVQPVGRLTDLDAMAQDVADVIVVDPTLGGVVRAAYPYDQRNTRGVVVAGIDLTVADLTVKVVQ